MTKPMIFISHSTADAAMVRRLMDFIQTTFNLTRENFFLTSDYQLELGGNWIEEIRTAMNESNIILPVITPSYLESKFCLCELGAAWVNQTALLPIIIPPLNYRALEETPYRSWLQSLTLISKDTLLELGDQLVRKQVGRINNMRQFDTRATDLFNETITPFIEELNKRESFTTSDFKKIQKELEDTEEAYQNVLAEMKKLKTENEQLRRMKDAEEVQIMDFENMEEWDHFIDAIDQVREKTRNLSDLTLSVLFHCYKHADARAGFTSPNDNTELLALADDGYIFYDDGFRPDSGHNAIYRTVEALEHLEGVISQYYDIIEERFDQEYQDVRLSLQFKPFWEKVLGIVITSSTS